MTDQTQANSRWPIDRLLGQVALATFGYYLLTFAFEVGFFWDAGLDLLPAFSVAEHAMHAAAYIIATVGVLAFVFACAHLLPVILHQASPPGPQAQQASAEPRPRATGWRRALALAMQAPALGVFVWGLATSVPEAGRRPSPTTFWLVLVCLAVSAHLVGQALNEPRRLWAGPTILLTILSPVALGERVFQMQTDGASPRQWIKLGDRRVAGRTLFVGSSNLLLLVGGRVVLTDQSRDMVVSMDVGRRRVGL